MIKKIQGKSPIFAWVLIIFLLCANFSYAAEPTKTFRNLNDRVNYLKDIIYYIQQNYAGQVSEEALMEGAYRGLFEALDPYSRYFTPEEFEAFEQMNSGSYSGIGATIGFENNQIVIIAPVEGGPAAKAGIKAGDIIVSVDGIDAKGSSLEKIVDKLLGKPGTKVKLGIRRADEKEILYFNITREVIHLPTVKARITEDNIGYIQIIEFNEKVSEGVEKVLADFRQKKVKGIILDLRNNPGGLIDEAVNIADFFIPKGQVVKIVFKDKSSQIYSSMKDAIKMPLAVLINEGSASASEIVAGAIQDTQVGTIIGTQSYGKGTVQSIAPISNGGGIKLTIAKYFTPKGRSIDGVGIKPDIIVNNPDKLDLAKLSSFVPMIEEAAAELGSKGLNVYGAQQRLQWMGYTDVKITGVMDETTVEAVKKFQGTEKLKASGILDGETILKLEEQVLKIMHSSVEDLQLKKAIEVIKNK
ncbi:carboxyl-terminal processing protease [Geosporobacter subterraneus DSM 17957]|uniref:Carboxyl-terminal processing protease n=1 Tax=Geosporobacter subterraneus DSM 17957 TaxID=1121919 RepID=A0A1M6NSP4_9FIRM|nr:S41 family peptidase [Geosporobacter subterraneus]SHJ98763.1 carboxyl-terminal processing protease [Geosporobacter subterraneus DSM 17957]